MGKNQEKRSIDPENSNNSSKKKKKKLNKTVVVDATEIEEMFEKSEESEDSEEEESMSESEEDEYSDDDFYANEFNSTEERRAEYKEFSKMAVKFEEIQRQNRVNIHRLNKKIDTIKTLEKKMDNSNLQKIGSAFSRLNNSLSDQQDVIESIEKESKNINRILQAFIEEKKNKK